MNDETFFRRKRSWSKYKDLILDYYLKPYLSKVAHLGKPIAVIDCFAGPGIFDDGELGSPLIISRRVAELQGRGYDARGIFIEKNQVLFGRLQGNTSSHLCETLQGDFHSHLDRLAAIAKTHTCFLYVDPIRPGDLLFDDLESAYELIKSNQSVEVLINFLSRGFVRRAKGFRLRASEGSVLSEGLGRDVDEYLLGDFDTQHPEVIACNRIAGGAYWQSLLLQRSVSNPEIVDAVAKGYADQLSRWFRWRLCYPIREKYEHKGAKYHLVFGSRHMDALELMNRAMVKARREFVGAQFVENLLFPNEPEKEVVVERDIEREVLEVACGLGKVEWKMLRVLATASKPCMYTDSEWNAAIKRLIVSRRLGSTSDGKKISDQAMVWRLDGVA